LVQRKIVSRGSAAAWSQFRVVQGSLAYLTATGFISKLYIMRFFKFLSVRSCHIMVLILRCAVTAEFVIAEGVKCMILVVSSHNQ